MEFLKLKDISERYMELINPTSTEKVLKIGQMAGMQPGWRVIDFGSGFGEALMHWGEQFGIGGVGIEVREYACERARQKLSEHGLSDRIEIVQSSATDYHFESHSFDAAVCMGASFLWGGFEGTIRAMREAIKPSGKLIIGEPYWVTDEIPPEWAQDQSDVKTELQLLQTARTEGFDFEYLVRASPDDWDRYEASNWYGLLSWIDQNPDHPERQDVIDELHHSQEEYFRFGRKYFGWAIFLLNPIKY